MDKAGYIEIRVVGSEGNNSLTPDNYDIREIKAMLENIEDIPQFDEAYLNNLIAKASPKFKNLDADIWLRDMRGGSNYE